MATKKSTPCLLAGLLLSPLVALAQNQPTAGQLLQQTSPPPPPAAQTADTTVEEPAQTAASASEQFAVREIRFSGNSAFPSEILAAVIAGDRHARMSLPELDALALKVTRFYRDHGYMVARAYLPPQDVSEGVVTIAVLEGQLGEIKLDDKAGLHGNATSPLHRLQSGEAVNRQRLENALLRLSDLPGVEVRSTLRPGASVGSSDFLVELLPTAALTGEIDVDNYGNRYVDAVRGGASLYWNNPSRHGDQFALRVQTSGDNFRYGRIGYQIPLGTQATRIGLAWSSMHYVLGKAFSALDAGGDASVFTLYLQQPLLRGRRASWYINAQYDDKRLRDEIGIIHLESRRRLRNATIGLRGDFIDGFGGGASNRILLDYTRGQLGMDAVSAFVDDLTARSRGSFGKWTLGYQRQQRLPAGWWLAINASAQWADRNLDSSEKLMLGGSMGVRAYPQGEASGDSGYIASFELRHRLLERLDGFGFYDVGRVRYNHSPWGGVIDNHRRLAGYGVGLNYSARPFSFQVFAAWKAGTGAPDSDKDKSPRVWAQVVCQF